MLDMGWTEILVIGVVALIVVGPKDLPRMLRTLGQYMGKLKGMAREFQRSMDDAAREADLAEFKDIKDTLNDVRSVQNDAAGAIRKGLNDIDKEVEKQTDLKIEEIDEDAPKKIDPPKDTAAIPLKETAEQVAASAPSPPAPGDLVDEEPAAAAPPPRAASGP